MALLNVFWGGIKEASCQLKMIFCLFLINSFVSLIVSIPTYGLFHEFIGRRKAAESLLKGFDFNILSELIAYRGDYVIAIMIVSLVLILLYVFISIFLTGGLLFVLTQIRDQTDDRGSKPHFTQTFFQGSGMFFGRFFRLCLYSALLWIIAGIVYSPLSIAGWFISDGGTDVKALLNLLWIFIGAGLFLVFFVTMILDYARIIIVTENSRFVFRSLIKSIRFIFASPGKTLSLYYLLLIAGITIFGIYCLLTLLMPSSSVVPFLVSFTIGQVFIASRCWLKIAFQSTQLSFYSSRCRIIR